MEKIIVQCDPDLKDLIPGYLSNRYRDIITIREYLEAGHLEEIRSIGHSMKGSGGGYGFDMITDLGGRIENAVLASDINEVDKAVQDLENFINRVEVIY